MKASFTRLPALPIDGTVTAILICLLTLVTSALYAQTSALTQCATEHSKAISDLSKHKPASLPGLNLLFDPDVAKGQQILQAWTDCVKGKSAPPMAFTTLNGESYDKASLTGKIVIVNFWFTTCVPCREEMPALNCLVSEYHDKDVLFLGFATDPPHRLTPAYFAQNKFDFTIISDAMPIATSFAVRAYPTTFIVDGQGIILDMWQGVGSDKMEPYQKAKATLDKLLSTNEK
jgi:thiol-disulfide isomerase/thioredoxin